MSNQAEPAQTQSRTGRRVGIAVFSLIVGGITAVLSIEIICSAFAPPVPSAVSCSEQVRQLWDSLLQARRSAQLELSEEAALERFRAQLGGRWQTLPEVHGACSSPTERDLLRQLLQLRFEEENSVRYEARGLAQSRDRVAKLVSAQVGTSSEPAP
ncbi:MAG TPA: hypothetical protein VHM70_03685 [Polyangiaceae bacterium]|jgi:hypothetical protein|nr:hypothetical protein [Polyangiaceae bacterium]